MHDSTSPPLTVLAVESSCDETAVAVVRDGHTILSNIVASQAALHAQYGGVFPEMASRQHVRDIVPTLEAALAEAGVTWDDIDAVAATYGPGLAGSLVVGLNFAKGLAMARDLPFIGVNHLEGHVYSAWLASRDGSRPPPPAFPALILIVSGGHTELLRMAGHGQYEMLGGTLDDAAGEAFDKVARMLGLGYPGGPLIQRAAETGDPAAFDFPRSTPGEYDFSFSGLKTAVLREVERQRRAGGALPVADLAASFQRAVVEALVVRVVKAAPAIGARQVLVAGGVAANGPLRASLAEALAPLAIPLLIPPLALCTDNAAPIAAAAYWRLVAGERSSLDLEAMPSLPLVGRGP